MLETLKLVLQQINEARDILFTEHADVTEVAEGHVIVEEVDPKLIAAAINLGRVIEALERA